MQILINKGADINSQDEIGHTALWLAVTKDGRGHLVKALLNSGCAVNLQDAREKRTPLQVGYSCDAVYLFVFHKQAGCTAYVDSDQIGAEGTEQLFPIQF